MAPKERKSEDDSSSTPKNDPPKNPPRRRKPTLGNPGADPQRIHREYVEQHTGGGEEPTPEAYERGLEQWHRLPGAVARPPAEVRVRDEDGTADEDAKASESDTPGEEADEVDGSPT